MPEFILDTAGKITIPNRVDPVDLIRRLLSSGWLSIDHERNRTKEARHYTRQMVAVVDGVEKVEWDDLDAFTQGYIEAAFWTSQGDGEPGTNNASGLWQEVEPGQWSSEFGFADLAPETLASMMADCDKFQRITAHLLGLAYSQALIDYDRARAGHDLWLTRNGHGAGYWDRGLGAVGNSLTEYAEAEGEVDLYVGDDGLVYA